MLKDLNSVSEQFYIDCFAKIITGCIYDDNLDKVMSQSLIVLKRSLVLCLVLFVFQSLNLVIKTFIAYSHAVFVVLSNNIPHLCYDVKISTGLLPKQEWRIKKNFLFCFQRRFDKRSRRSCSHM